MRSITCIFQIGSLIFGYRQIKIFKLILIYNSSLKLVIDIMKMDIVMDIIDYRKILKLTIVFRKIQFICTKYLV